jgi:spermidine/putrescine transport system ATP-binding protein
MMDVKDYEIELVDINKSYGNFVAVKDSNIKIKHGEFFSLLGPSGCGKTTTWRMIGGFEDPTEEPFFLSGEDVTLKPPYQRNVNTVFQDYALFPHMNIYENVYFPLKMKKISKAKADPMIKDILKLVNMSAYENRLPQQLSGGQRQRIALARSLVNRPRALLLDEPLGALDFKLRIAMQKVLKDIQKNVDITFIYVTHDQTEAITMSDRICVMKDGLIHQIGSPDEIYNHPATSFVAGFIGDMNFIDAVVENAAGGEIIVDVGSVKISSSRVNNGFTKGDKVCLCIRPEKINSSLTCDFNKYINCLEGRLNRIVFRGNDYELTLNIGNSEIRLIESSNDFIHKSIGDLIKFRFKKEDAIIFKDEKQGNENGHH